MRLSTILELLLIFLIIAFSAYCTDARVINDREARAVRKKQSAVISPVVSLKQATESVNKYCRCSDNICNCCRDFDIPLVKLPGPGCASLQYIPDDKLAMQLSVGENILSTNIVNGKNPKPVCVNLPGGFSKFCGKVYNIQREEDKHFKACLGLELQSTSDELEATLRVSCFRFGPDGLKLRPAEPYPTVLTKEPSTASDDDYEDIFGLGDDDEDDEDDEDYEKVSPEDPAANETQAQEAEDQEEDDEDDILGFSALLDLITGGDDTPAKKKQSKGTTTTTTTLIPSNFLIPIIATSSQKPVTSKTPAAVSEDSVTPENNDVHKTQNESVTVSEIEADTTFDPFEDTTRVKEEGEEDSTSADYGVTEEPAPAPANKVAPVKVNAPPKPSTTTEKFVKVKKTQVAKKKVSITSQSVNAINDVKKPAAQHQEESNEDDEDQDDDYDYSDSSADDDDEDESSSEDTKHEETDKNEDDEETNAQEEYEDDDDDDDDDEEEDAVLTALVGGEDSDKEETKKKPTAVKQSSSTKKSTDVQDDYEGLADLLARKHPARPEAKVRGRQSKVMRL